MHHVILQKIEVNSNAFLSLDSMLKKKNLEIRKWVF